MTKTKETKAVRERCACGKVRSKNMHVCGACSQKSLDRHRSINAAIAEVIRGLLSVGKHLVVPTAFGNYVVFSLDARLMEWHGYPEGFQKDTLNTRMFCMGVDALYSMAHVAGVDTQEIVGRFPKHV